LKLRKKASAINIGPRATTAPSKVLYSKIGPSKSSKKTVLSKKKSSAMEDTNIIELIC